MSSAAPLHPLRQWRQERGLSQEACARAVGTSHQVWSDWERGRFRPGPVLMPKVREFTGGAVSADDFYPGAEAA